MRILLVRHDESEWNASRRLQGQADIALSDRGREQARLLRPMIEALAPDAVIASDLARAAETARILGADTAALTPALREIDVGNWTGEPITQIIAREPEHYAGWRAGTHAPEGGETWAAFRSRVAAAVERAAEGTNHLLVVCHGGVIRALIEHFLELAPARIIPVGPASLTALRLGKGPARLELFNVTPGRLELSAPD
ncbi:histidine phosphatase family protein [Paracoccus sp. S-4012]|uniref:histidine phosphatase family protein n=1 Tax=Paracoccus sp. S-4012 TaxID=2665648 RepID=UPI001E3AAE83|nr:histidine phosphatase family protein [Paracoccus sp. S-4012]